MTPDEIIQKILKLRGITNPGEFFNPTHPKDIKSPFDSQPAIDLIRKHIFLNNKIMVYGDYDVDGICATAILWETLYSGYKNVFPHIPHRESEGYGLSIKGVDHCLAQEAKLIITVDNGIVAFDQIDYIRQKGCDVIVIDHHEPDTKLPNANVILHSKECCASGLAWFFSRDYLSKSTSLELATIATVCDLVPLVDLNRSFVKHGLVELQNTRRVGLLALIQEAMIKKITPYEIGFIIGPRLNAMGRLEHAIDSLRLLCTHDVDQAAKLAKLLGDTNRQRQDETKNAVDHALGMIDENNLPDLIVVSDTGYHAGVIGLIAGKLTEKYHRPSVAISIGETESKASCRSIVGFHITKYLRNFDKLLMAVGGHSMAAGFTVSNSNLPKLLKKLNNIKIDPKILVKKQRVDLEIPLSSINYELLSKLKELEPFGLGNPSPVFSTSGVEVSNVKSVGKDGKHMKLKVGELDAIWFNAKIITDGLADVVYHLEINEFNGKTSLQLNVRDIMTHGSDTL
ncbi:single-stranded-DNA-specific exonuclease RecJ [Candidatus Amesbacteria bacterium]|nr:single-stranded-DNA-specific exonuclease RecJ [Candidatus Amesbacteria bacterium]